MWNDKVAVKLEIYAYDNILYYYQDGSTYSENYILGEDIENKRYVECVEGTENVRTYLFTKWKEKWCAEWKKLDEKDQLLIMAVYGKSFMHEKYDNMDMKEPEQLLKAAEIVLYKKGFNEPCSRCAGSGEHSYNQRFGKVCFKCKGKKRALQKIGIRQVKKWLKEYPDGIYNEDVIGNGICEELMSLK